MTTETTIKERIEQFSKRIEHPLTKAAGSIKTGIEIILWDSPRAQSQCA